MQLNQVTVSVADIDASVAFYQKLGLKLIVYTGHYARFIVPGNQASFSIHKTGNSASSGTVVYFECDTLDEKVAELKHKGLVFDEDPTNQTWLWREAYLSDPDGNKICLYHAGENRLNPPWRLKD